MASSGARGYLRGMSAFTLKSYRKLRPGASMSKGLTPELFEALGEREAIQFVKETFADRLAANDYSVLLDANGLIVHQWGSPLA